MEIATTIGHPALLNFIAAHKTLTGVSGTAASPGRSFPGSRRTMRNEHLDSDRLRGAVRLYHGSYGIHGMSGLGEVCRVRDPPNYRSGDFDSDKSSAGGNGAGASSGWPL